MRPFGTMRARASPSGAWHHTLSCGPLRGPRLNRLHDDPQQGYHAYCCAYTQPADLAHGLAISTTGAGIRDNLAEASEEQCQDEERPCDQAEPYTDDCC